MALTTLDPRTALIVIDLQQGIRAYPTVHPADEVVARAAALAAAFRRRSLPVVLVTVVGGAPGRVERTRSGGPTSPEWFELAPELDRQPEDHVVAKRTWGAFTNTGLREHLAALGVTQVVIAGIATCSGVESTARHAHELGFNVTLAIDAMTDTDADAHANSVARVFPRLGETGTTAEILALLDGARG
ncbi:isochorismatase family protein [Geothrix sp. 21YS21S-4]|uniref:isochorismatase family protein n=1 Tax=Geothrix sp. 21YS21S-4 TaxID=3068889 RepID=UPI0027B908A5|nr:isochorismatase family protein [Geothrix sp. 21YS21S-4]